jgi:hypothetical protein
VGEFCHEDRSILRRNGSLASLIDELIRDNHPAATKALHFHANSGRFAFTPFSATRCSTKQARSAGAPEAPCFHGTLIRPNLSVTLSATLNPMQKKTLFLSPMAFLLLTAEPGFPQTKTESPQYVRKVEGDWIVGPTLKWPLRNKSLPEEQSALVSARWRHGTEAKLSVEDMAAISKAVLENLPKTEAKIGTIKKISDQEYMVQASFSGGGYWFVVARSANEWSVIAFYIRWIS